MKSIWKFRPTSVFVCTSLLILSLNHLGSEAKKTVECYVEEDGPKDDPNNIYKCETGEKCCREEGKPSCCRPRPVDEAAKDQAKLWGTLAGLILVLALIMFCCRHDGDCCCYRKDGGRYKYCCCGPIIYREGKGPNQDKDNPEAGWMDSDEEEDDDFQPVGKDDALVTEKNEDPYPEKEKLDDQEQAPSPEHQERTENDSPSEDQERTENDSPSEHQERNENDSPPEDQERTENDSPPEDQERTENDSPPEHQERTENDSPPPYTPQAEDNNEINDPHQPPPQQY